MSFSATDAAFEGFRVVRRNPLALVAWTLVYLVYALGALFASGGMMKSMAVWVEQMEALENGPQPQSLEALAPIMESYFAAMSHMAWAIPAQMIISAILMAAIARAVLASKGDALGHVRLGIDEVRVFLVTLVICVMLVLASVLSFFLAAVVGGFAVAAMDGWGGLIMALALLAAGAFVIWLCVRWSLAVPITVAEKRFAIFDSFNMTKGRFWPLLGMALIAGVMAIVISLLASVVSMPLTMMGGMSMFGNMTGDDPMAIFENFDPTSPWMIASAVVNAIIYALTVAVVYAPFTAAYKDIKGS